MLARRLGASGPIVSAIGIGGMSLVDGYYGTVAEQEAIAAVHRAFDLGITLFDTADGYGDGESERRLGKALASRRDEVVIATKFGLVPGPGGGERVVDGRPENVAHAIEGSLRRLGVESVDLYQLHRVDPLVPVEETIGAMSELVAAGKARYLGLSEATAAQIAAAASVWPITSLQSEYSMFERGIEREVLPACERVGCGVLAFAPLGKGLLTGALQDVRGFAEDDLRHRLPRFEGANLGHNQQVVRRLDEIATDAGVTQGQLALAWLLDRAPWIVPIPGSHNPTHLEENARAADIEVNKETIAQVDAAFTALGVAGDRYPKGWPVPHA